MASEKELNIKVNTETELSSLEDLQNVLESVKSEMEEINNTNIEINDVEEISNDANDLALALDDAGVSLEDLRSILDSLSSESIKQAKEDTDELGDSFDAINDKQLDISAGAMLNFVSNEAQSASTASEQFAQDINNARISVGQLATQTGVAEPQMVNLINHISNVTFPQEEAMAYVSTLNRMGVSADKLGDSATNMDKINDATGMGYQKVIQLTMGLKSLGVSGDNLPSTFNAIAYAQSNVNGGADTLSTVLKRQASTINEYGLNVDQLVLIMEAFSKKGIQGMKMGSELSKVLKETNGDTKALEQSLGLQEGALDSANSKTKQYQGQLQKLADEEMQHKTVLERISAWFEDFSLSASGFLSPFAGLVGVIGEFGRFTLALNGTTVLLQNMVNIKQNGIKAFLGFANSAEKVTESVTSTSNAVKSATDTTSTASSILKDEKGNVNGLRNALSTLKGKFVEASAKALEFALNTKARLVELATTAKTTLVNAFSGVVTKAKELGMALLDLGKKALISGYNALKSAGMWLVEKASLIASAVAKGVATVSSWALAVAEWAVASPILIIVAIVLILIGVLIYLYNTNETVRNAINNLGQTFMMIGQTIYNAFMNAVNMVIGFLTNLWNYITSIGQMILQSVGITGNNIMSSILGFIVFMATLPLQIGIIFTNIIAKALGFGDNFAQRMLSTAINGVKNFVNNIGGMYNGLKNELNKMLSEVGQWATKLWNMFKDAGKWAVDSFLTALGIRSPGIMQRTLVWEISEMGKRVPEESQNLLTNVGKLGTNIVDEFGEPSLGINYDDTANATIDNNLNGNTQGQGGNTFNINIGNVDSEDRVNEIVDAVKKALAFENETAGRNV